MGLAIYLGIGGWRIRIAVGKRACVVGLVFHRGLYFVAERKQLVGVFNHLRKILLLAVGVVIERINIDQKRGIRIFGYKIIERLDLLRRLLDLLRGGEGIVFRHRVLRLRGILPLRCGGRARLCQRVRGACHQAKRRCDREARQYTYSVHSDVSSLEFQAGVVSVMHRAHARNLMLL